MRKVALAEIAGRGAFVANAHFAGRGSAVAADPVADAYRAGLAEGRRSERAAIDAELAATARAQDRIALAFARFDEDAAALLQERLRSATLAICQSMAGEIALDPDRLTARVRVAAALLRRSHDERVVRLHPDDLALVADRLPADMPLDPDPSLAPGELRIESAEGGVEDGAVAWREALAEALGPCMR